jgi:hypothetical protein
MNELNEAWKFFSSSIARSILTQLCLPVLVAWLVSRWTLRDRITVEQAKGLIQEGLARMKAQLDREAKVHEIKFRKLYDNMSTVITNTYRLLTRAYESGAEFIAPASTLSQEDRANKFAEDFKKLGLYVSRNRIFLPKRLHDVVIEFLQPLRATALEFQFGLLYGHPPSTQPTPQKMAEHYSKANTAFQETIVPLYNRLCAEMQTFLGLEE